MMTDNSTCFHPQATTHYDRRNDIKAKQSLSDACTRKTERVETEINIVIEGDFSQWIEKPYFWSTTYIYQT